MKPAWLIIILILLFSFIPRIRDINRPLLDAHYFRQTQTAVTAKNFYRYGIDFFHTQLDVFGTGKEKTIVLEFPLYQSIVTGISYAAGFHDYVGRLTALIMALFAGIVLVLLTNKLFTRRIIGVAALVFFLFNPLNYYFQQAFMIESTIILLYLLSIYLWMKYSENKRYLWQSLATITTVFAFLHKTIYAPFLLLVIIAVLFFKLGSKEFKKLRWLPGIIFSVLILLTWQYYVNVTNLHNGHANFTLDSSSQQLWNFGTLSERFDVNNWTVKFKFIQNSVTKFQWPMFLLGLVFLAVKKEKAKFVLFFWLLTMGLYYLWFFRIQSHDYYFMLVTPVISIIAAYGLITFVRLVTGKFAESNSRGYIVIFIISLYLSIFAYKSIQNAGLYFQVDPAMVNRLDTYNSVIKTDGNILFIFPEYDWNSVYTYYTNHKGLVFAAKSITPDLVTKYTKLGYRYAVIDGVDAIEDLKKVYPAILIDYNTLLSQDGIIILDLTQPKRVNKIS